MITIGAAIEALTIAVQATAPYLPPRAVSRIVHGLLHTEITAGFWRQA